eukprot:7109327-Ditylum_brightwellii.AAC.1
MEQELLAIVETLKEFENILPSQQIRVYTDHKNLRFVKSPKQNNSSQPLNTDNELFLLAKLLTANDMKGLEKEEILLSVEKPDGVTIAECYVDNGESTIPPHVYPLNFKLLQMKQHKDKVFLEALKKSETKYDLKIFQGVHKSKSLICQEGKIIVPPLLWKQILDWYHTALCYSDTKRTKLTICQHFEWKKLSND